MDSKILSREDVMGGLVVVADIGGQFTGAESSDAYTDLENHDAAQREWIAELEAEERMNDQVLTQRDEAVDAHDALVFLIGCETEYSNLRHYPEIYEDCETKIEKLRAELATERAAYKRLDEFSNNVANQLRDELGKSQVERDEFKQQYVIRTAADAAELAALRVRLEAHEKDTARLDWRESHKGHSFGMYADGEWADGCGGSHATYREAIDAAMSGEKTNEKG